MLKFIEIFILNESGFLVFLYLLLVVFAGLTSIWSILWFHVSEVKKTAFLKITSLIYKIKFIIFFIGLILLATNGFFLKLFFCVYDGVNLAEGLLLNLSMFFWALISGIIFVLFLLIPMQYIRMVKKIEIKSLFLLFFGSCFISFSGSIYIVCDSSSLDLMDFLMLEKIEQFSSVDKIKAILKIDTVFFLIVLIYSIDEKYISNSLNSEDIPYYQLSRYMHFVYIASILVVAFAYV